MADDVPEWATTKSGSFRVPEVELRRKDDVTKGRVQPHAVINWIARAHKHSARAERAVYAAILYGLAHDILHALGVIR